MLLLFMFFCDREMEQVVLYVMKVVEHATSTTSSRSFISLLLFATSRAAHKY